MDTKDADRIIGLASMLKKFITVKLPELRGGSANTKSRKIDKYRDVIKTIHVSSCVCDYIYLTDLIKNNAANSCIFDYI